MKIGYLILIILCCSTCKKEDYREKYVGIYDTIRQSKFVYITDSTSNRNYFFKGPTEISISNEGLDILTVKFDTSLQSLGQNKTSFFDNELVDNKIDLVIDEDGNAKVIVESNFGYRTYKFLLFDNKFTFYYFNEDQLARKITHFLSGVKREK